MEYAKVKSTTGTGALTVELENGDSIDVRIVVGPIKIVDKNPDGSNNYHVSTAPVVFARATSTAGPVQ